MHHHDGMPIRTACARAGISHTTFYALRSQLADDEAEIRRAAEAERQEAREAFRRRMELAAREMRDLAIERYRAVAERLLTIAAGEPWEVELPDGTTKTIIPYPRDIVTAAGKVQELMAGFQAADVLPQNREPALPPMPAFAGLGWKSVTLEAADGTVIEETVIDGEAEELD